MLEKAEIVMKRVLWKILVMTQRKEESRRESAQLLGEYINNYE